MLGCDPLDSMTDRMPSLRIPRRDVIAGTIARVSAAVAASVIFAGWGAVFAQTPAQTPTQTPAQPPPLPSLEKPPLRAESSSRRGLLYEVKSGAGTVYLFGTIHVGKPDFYPLDAQVNRAFAASSALYLEVNLSDTALVMNASTMATYPEGTSLDRSLSPSFKPKLYAALDRYQLPREAAMRMKPWMLGQTLLLMEATRRGYDPAYATEMHLLGLAAAQGKEVRGLETLAEQFAIFDRMPEEGQQRFLEDIVAALDSPQMAMDLDALVGAWSHGDAHGLEDELARERAEGTAFARDVLPQLVDDRNRTMTDRIADIARSGKTTFVAVGALHLVGPKGVVALLRAQGLTVTAL
jgi:uncharacterized protein YbaP (TraB family)